MRGNPSPIFFKKYEHGSLTMRKRCELNFVADVLRLTLKGSKKPWIVKSANTNFSKFNKLLDILVEKKLITISEDKIFTSAKGLEYLERYDKLMSMWNSDGKKPFLAKKRFGYLGARSTRPLLKSRERIQSPYSVNTNRWPIEKSD